MKSYGQFCPVAKAAQLFCRRWTPLIVRDLSAGPLRFSDIQRGVPLMSPALLSRRLRELVLEGVVVRHREQGKRATTYRLSPSGEELVPLVVLLGTWGQRFTRRDLAADEVDLGLFLWAFQRSVDRTAFGARRTVIRLDVAGQPRGKRRWWFVNDPGSLDLCLEDPGHEVDLYIAASLQDLIRLWRGDLELAEAIARGRLAVDGPSPLRRAFRAWFGVSVLAHIPSVRVAAPARPGPDDGGTPSNSSRRSRPRSRA